MILMIMMMATPMMRVMAKATMKTWVPRLSSEVRAPLVVSQTLIRVPLLLAVANRVPEKMILMMVMILTTTTMMIRASLLLAKRKTQQ